MSLKHTYHFVGTCYDGNRSFPAEIGDVPGSATIETAVNGVLLDVTSSTLEEAKALAAKAIKRLR